MIAHGPEEPDPAPPSPPDDALEGAETPTAPGLARTAPRSVSELHLKGIIESLVFVAEKPITVPEIAAVARAEAREVRRLLNELRAEYTPRGIHLDEIAGAWQFRSSAANAPFVRELLQARPVKLTRAQVETLSIVAYRQPITRPEVDDVRGVDSGSALKVLLDRNLIRMIGRKDEPGRPMLYGTTTNFLEFFGLRSLRDLPVLREYTELSPESEATLAREMADGGENAESPESSSAKPAETDGAAGGNVAGKASTD
ncbi:MAG: SMC-Scp complex subunit ScpB [Polyangiales bacterium]